MTLLEFIIEATKHGEFEIGPNIEFDKKHGKYYGFSWITGPMFSNSIESLTNQMIKKAEKRKCKPMKKIFVIEPSREVDGRYL